MVSRSKPMTLEALIDLGFDLSYDDGDGYSRLWCSQCDALVISGHPCHESGCPNEPKEEHQLEEELYDEIDY